MTSYENHGCSGAPKLKKNQNPVMNMQRIPALFPAPVFIVTITHQRDLSASLKCLLSWLHMEVLRHLEGVGLIPQIKLSSTHGEKGNDFHWTAPTTNTNSVIPMSITIPQNTFMSALYLLYLFAV